MRFYVKNKDTILAVVAYNGFMFVIEDINYSVANIKFLRFLQSNEDFNAWLNRRQSPFSRENMHELFKESSIKSIIDFITTSKCLSLNDTFWICSISDNLKWKDVSL